MGTTTKPWSISTTDPAKITQWHKLFYRDTLIRNPFAAMEGISGKTPVQKGPTKYVLPNGTDASNVITINRDLGANKGSTLRFHLIEKLDSDIVGTEADVITGSGQGQTTRYFDATLEFKFMSVATEDRMSEQRSGYNVSVISREQLVDAAAERRAKDYRDALVLSPTLFVYKDATGYHKTSSAATAKAALTVANGYLDPKFVQSLYTAANTGFNRTIWPLRPIMINGKPYYVLMVHSDVVASLMGDPTWAAGVAMARERGPENPLFNMADIMTKNMLITGTELMPIATDGGSGADVAWAHGVVMGCQALLRAEGKPPRIVKGEINDHQTKEEFSYQYVQKTVKPVFDGVTYGSFSVYVARDQISDM